MSEAEIIDSSNSSSLLKKFFLILAAVAIFVFVVGISFYLGRRTKEIEIQPTPTPSFPSLSQTTSTPEPSPTSATGSANLSPTQTPPPRSVIITSEPELDGYRSSNGTGNSRRQIRVGRNEELVSRGFLSFSLDDLPAGANVQEATLRIYQTDTRGEPFGTGSNLLIDHLNYGDTLDSTDYAIPSLLSNFETLSSSEQSGWKEVNVTNRVKDDLSNARTLTQYRIHFEREVTDDDTDEDFVYFESADNYENTGNLPQIVVKYY